MRVLENKPFKASRVQVVQDAIANTVTVAETKIETSYFELISDMLNRPPQGGWKTGDGMKQLRSRLSAIGQIKTALEKEEEPFSGTVNLEESEYDEVMSAYKEWAWSLTSIAVVEFDEYLTQLKKVSAN